MKLHIPTTNVQLGQVPQEERIIFSPAPQAAVNADPEVQSQDELGEQAPPPLASLERRVGNSEGIPPLEPVQRTRRTVELSPPASTVPEASTPSIPPLEPVRRTRQVIELAPTQPVTEAEVTADSGNEADVERNDEYAENLEGLERDIVEADVNTDSIPPLTLVRAGSVEPDAELLTDIPPLEVYNTMEVVHLLLGRSVEDEEVVLLRSYSERTLRAQKPEALSTMLIEVATNHYATMRQELKYDMAERSEQRSLHLQNITPAQTVRGLEWACYLGDDGTPTEADITAIVDQYGGSRQEAQQFLNQTKEDYHYVYAWALVKVKIGHDFGAQKLSDLMPML